MKNHYEIMTLLAAMGKENRATEEVSFSEYLSLYCAYPSEINKYDLFYFIKGCVLFENKVPRFGSATPLPRFLRYYLSHKVDVATPNFNDPLKKYEALIDWVVENSENPWCAFGEIKLLEQYQSSKNVKLDQMKT